MPLELVDRAPAPERGESPVTPERFAVLQAMLADVLAACGERKDAIIDAAELAARFKLDRRGARGSPAAAQPRQLRRRLLRGLRRARRGRPHDPRREGAVRRRVPPPGAALPARGQGAAAGARPRRPARGRRRRHRRSTTCARSSRRRSGATTCAARPTPQPTPLDEDVLSVLSAAVRSRRSWRSSTSARQDDDGASAASSSRTTCAACAATGTATPGIARATASARSASTASSKARALDETFERRESVTARVDGALGDRAGTASVWFSADVARWELEDRARHRAPGRRRRARVGRRTARSAGCATELCRYLGDAVLLEPEALRARVAARARELAAHVRAHATTSAQ